MFLALDAGYMFSLAWHWLHVFPRLALVTCYSRLTLVTCFPAFGTGCMFSRAWHWLHVFPRLVLVACFQRLVLVRCFPALGAGFPKLSNGYVTWRPRLDVFTCFVPAIACFRRHRPGQVPCLELILIGSQRWWVRCDWSDVVPLTNITKNPAQS